MATLWLSWARGCRPKRTRMRHSTQELGFNAKNRCRSRETDIHASNPNDVLSFFAVSILRKSIKNKRCDCGPLFAG